MIPLPRTNAKRGNGQVCQSPTLPADIRRANLRLILEAFCLQQKLSRSDLSRVTGLGIPTVHRLVSEMEACGILQIVPMDAEGQLGRPAAIYQINPKGLVVVGIDVGNETTRVGILSPAGGILALTSGPTECTGRQLASSLVERITSLMATANVPIESMACVGVGVSAVVDPETGVLRNAPQRRDWNGINLGAELNARLGCAVNVRQDDHFSVVAEAGPFGTFANARSLLVLEIGKGIGAAMAVDGKMMTGANGRFGRIADWPAPPMKLGFRTGATIGDALVADGLIAQYQQRGGSGDVTSGETLFAAAAAGDRVARAVVAWAGHEIGQLVARLAQFCDPEAIVIGGGLAQGFALLEPHITQLVPRYIPVRGSILGLNAVILGAVLGSRSTIESWIEARLEQPESEFKVLKKESPV